MQMAKDIKTPSPTTERNTKETAAHVEEHTIQVNHEPMNHDSAPLLSSHTETTENTTGVVHQMMNEVNNTNETTQLLFRVEFQQRGKPHEHTLLTFHTHHNSISSTKVQE